jgi:hypothetical protein
MSAERLRPWLLGALALALAAVVYRAWPATTSATTTTTSTTSGAVAATSNGGGTAQPASRAGARTPAPASGPVAPDVHIAALSGDRVKPVDRERNLFRFKTKPAPPPPLAPERFTGPVMPVPSGPPQPPPVPPITLKFIGLFDTGDQKPKIAILSDSAGHVFYGTEGGPPIEGRYRITKIGAESIELSYLDGRGRTTLRLSGS